MADFRVPILPFRTEAAGRVPDDQTLDELGVRRLEVGEIAFNVRDALIYTKRSDGEIVQMGGSTLGRLLDVDVPDTPLEGQSLIWNQARNAWTAGQGSNLEDLKNVQDVLPASGEILVWNNKAKLWEPKPASISDVELEGEPSAGELLTYKTTEIEAQWFVGPYFDAFGNQWDGETQIVVEKGINHSVETNDPDQYFLAPYAPIPGVPYPEIDPITTTKYFPNDPTQLRVFQETGVSYGLNSIIKWVQTNRPYEYYPTNSQYPPFYEYPNVYETGDLDHGVIIPRAEVGETLGTSPFTLEFWYRSDGKVGYEDPNYATDTDYADGRPSNWNDDQSRERLVISAPTILGTQGESLRIVQDQSGDLNTYTDLKSSNRYDPDLVQFALTPLGMEYWAEAKRENREIELKPTLYQWCYSFPSSCGDRTSVTDQGGDGDLIPDTDTVKHGATVPGFVYVRTNEVRDLPIFPWEEWIYESEYKGRVISGATGVDLDPEGTIYGSKVMESYELPPGSRLFTYIDNEGRDTSKPNRPGGLLLKAGYREVLCSTRDAELDDNNWHHIIFQHEGGGIYSCFVDGELVDRRERFKVWQVDQRRDELRDTSGPKAKEDPLSPFTNLWDRKDDFYQNVTVGPVTFGPMDLVGILSSQVSDSKSSGDPENKPRISCLRLTRRALHKGKNGAVFSTQSTYGPIAELTRWTNAAPIVPGPIELELNDFDTSPETTSFIASGALQGEQSAGATTHVSRGTSSITFKATGAATIESSSWKRNFEFVYGVDTPGQLPFSGPPKDPTRSLPNTGQTEGYFNFTGDGGWEPQSQQGSGPLGTQDFTIAFRAQVLNDLGLVDGVILTFEDFANNVAGLRVRFFDKRAVVDLNSATNQYSLRTPEDQLRFNSQDFQITITREGDLFKLWLNGEVVDQTTFSGSCGGPLLGRPWIGKTEQGTTDSFGNSLQDLGDYASVKLVDVFLKIGEAYWTDTFDAPLDLGTGLPAFVEAPAGQLAFLKDGSVYLSAGKTDATGPIWSQLVAPGGAGGAELGGLNDVLINKSTLRDNDVLTWNGQAWVALPASTGLGSLEDVDLVVSGSLIDRRALVYDAGSQKWIQDFPVLNGTKTDLGPPRAILGDTTTLPLLGNEFLYSYETERFEGWRGRRGADPETTFEQKYYQQNYVTMPREWWGLEMLGGDIPNIPEFGGLFISMDGGYVAYRGEEGYCDRDTCEERGGCGVVVRNEADCSTAELFSTGDVGVDSAMWSFAIGIHSNSTNRGRVNRYMWKEHIDPDTQIRYWVLRIELIKNIAFDAGAWDTLSGHAVELWWGLDGSFSIRYGTPFGAQGNLTRGFGQCSFHSFGQPIYLNRPDIWDGAIHPALHRWTGMRNDGYAENFCVYIGPERRTTATYPIGTPLSSHVDVHLEGAPKNGQALLWSDADQAWKPGNVVTDWIDESTPRTRGDVVTWDGTTWVPRRAPASDIGRGDGGDFGKFASSKAEIFSPFLFGIYGGGNWDDTSEDLPIERTKQTTIDAGELLL